MNNEKQMIVGRGPKINSILGVALLAFAVGCNKPNPGPNALKNFDQVNLVANTMAYRPVTVDQTLLNAFGIAWSPGGTAWVNSVGGHVSELYSGEGAILRKPVNIPFTNTDAGGFPCGIVFSGGKGFNLPTGAATFLFTGFEGVLSGWNNPLGDTAKRIKAPAGASYTGLAIGSDKGRNLIYAANFGQSKIDVWDTNFSRITMPFTDPSLPGGYSPYNIQAVGDYLFVLYGELETKGDNKGHAIAGAGKGVVSVFNMDGTFVKRFASRGSLNVPWGVTMAPGSFLDNDDMDLDANDVNSKKNGGNGGNDESAPVILIGNFGDGTINVFTMNGNYLGQLKSHKRTIVIDGLWALSFAPTSSGIDQSRLYFTAGPRQEQDGLFGYLIKR